VVPPIDRPFVGGWLAVIFTVMAVLGLGAIALRQAQNQKALAESLTGGDAAYAPGLLTRYGCGGCHTIAGVPGADGRVGPALEGLLQRVYIGGTLQNTPDNLVAWLVDPLRFSPHTAMPPTGIRGQEARDIAAYLYAH